MLPAGFPVLRDHTMERPGTRLKQVREKLGLTYRHVEKASQQIAANRGNDEFSIALSRLADIENKGTVPTIYRLYSLCAIYRLDFNETLRWYGVGVEMLAGEALRLPLPSTHLLQIEPAGPFPIPQAIEKEMNFNETTFLGHFLRRWGKSGLGFLAGLDARQHRYGLIGLEDWSMHPVLHPGSLVLIDQARRKIEPGGWTSELDRPIYFLEHRDGYRCGWCTEYGSGLLVHPHPSSQTKPEMFTHGEFDVIGQVAGVAMLLDSKQRRQPRSVASSAASPDR
jgi:transcriptional regulator with XRE-family HTH domain